MTLVTGATGYVGRALIARLAQERSSTTLIAATRCLGTNLPQGCQQECVGEIDSSTDWTRALRGVQAVIHCAARVHIMNETSVDSLAEFRRVNVDGTANLAKQAAARGVRRFVYLSSVKVNGEHTPQGHAFARDDVPAPQDHYGISKAEAEASLREISRQSGMELVIIRPPLVYGPGVKANFATMVHWVRKGAPLPLGAIHNRRSLVALGNLVDLIAICHDHPKAANQTFMVSDGHDLSTTDLLRQLAHAMERPARLLPVPQLWLEASLRLMGRSDWVPRLCGNLQVDISHTCDTLCWQPPVSVAEGLRQAVAG